MTRKLIAASILSYAIVAHPASADTFASGTLIVPMDTTYQDNGTLKAFGLAYRLLASGVPVRWVIKTGKAHLGVDFTASAVDIKTNAVISSYGYRGGPFVIDSADAATALPIIQAWQTANPSVTVHRATSTFSGDVSRYLVAAPRTAVHADGNQGIAISYLNAAGIPDSNGQAWPASSPDLLTPAEVAGPTTTNHHDGALFDSNGNPVYCQFMSMHWDVKAAAASPETVQEVRAYLGHQVHFFAECQAVNAFEGQPPVGGNGNFLTTHGYQWPAPAQPKTYDYYNNDSPFAQMDGSFLSVGGSEPAYSLASGSAYKSNDVVLIKQQGTLIGTQDLWMTGFLEGACSSEASTCGTVGKVSYLGGHQYPVQLPISKNPSTNGTRLFLNSLFEAPCMTSDGQPSIDVSTLGPSATTSATVTITVEWSNGGTGVALGGSLADKVPAGASFVGASNGGTFSNGVVKWTLGTMGPNAAGTYTFTVTLPGYGTYTNTANLTYNVGVTPGSASAAPLTIVYDKDTDGDGVFDPQDICPLTYDPMQSLATDPLTCGSCNNACTVANGSPACVGGVCQIASCTYGFSNCDGLTATGCEYSTSSFDSDPNNCGGCGNRCAFPNASAICATNVCVFGTCNAGFQDCNGSLADGCEYNMAGFASDPKHCGSCWTVCQSGFSCIGGSCEVSSCPAGTSDCDGIAANGCEYSNSSFDSDPANCGGCRLACAPANAFGACVSGACVVASCSGGFADCNGVVADGCEYASAGFDSDVKNCGSCNITCVYANADAACLGGACAMTGCSAGFSDCDADPATGCEYDDQGFQSDPQNCGRCGNVCNSGSVCSSGSCVSTTCSPGTNGCDGGSADAATAATDAGAGANAGGATASGGASGVGGVSDDGTSGSSGQGGAGASTGGSGARTGAGGTNQDGGADASAGGSAGVVGNGAAGSSAGALAGTGGAGMSAGTSETGGSGANGAGSSTRGDVDAGLGPAGADSGDTGSCGCAVPGRKDTTPEPGRWFFAAVLGAVLARARGRHARRHKQRVM